MQQVIVKAHVRRYAGDAHDLTDWSPPVLVRRGVDDNGEPFEIHEKVPSAASVKCVNLAGSITRRVVVCGSGKPAENDAHRLQVVAEMLEKGWVPYGTCPKELGLQKWLPKEQRDGMPCKSSVDEDGTHHPIDDEHCCECINTIEKVRKAAQFKKTARVNERFKTDSTRKLEVQQDQLAMMTSLLEKLHGTDAEEDLREQVAELEEQVAVLKKSKKR